MEIHLFIQKVQYQQPLDEMELIFNKSLSFDDYLSFFTLKYNNDSANAGFKLLQ